MQLNNAPVAELADAPDLGSGVPDVKVQVLSGAPQNRTNRTNTRFVLFYLTLTHEKTTIFLVSEYLVYINHCKKPD